jgi:lysophospholipase L1-like esterase
VGAATPSAKRGCIVLFQGDSVTDVGRNKTSTKPNDLGGLGNGYPLLVASEILRADPNTPWQFFNRGISGNKVPDLEARWDADTLAIKPDILSLLIGVNDYWHTKTHGYTGTAAQFESQLTALLARTKAALPSVRLVLLEPFVLKVGAVDDSWFPAFSERQAIVARVARTANATFVALQTPLSGAAQGTGPAHWAADGVHPTPAGHAFIAEQWRAAVKL